MSSLQDLTTPEAQQIADKLGDRWWRINNLYYIKDEDGNKILFKPNEVQKILYDNMWFYNIVPKARQLGITTFFTIFYLDQVLFGSNKTATIIAHTEKDMKKIFRNKVKFAYDNLPPAIKHYIGDPDTDTANELSFPNGSMISVALSSRSDTVQFLHISEFGKICAKYPDKADEIVTGALNAVHAGNMVSIESTSEGQGGHFHDFCMKAEQMRLESKELTPFDFKIFFFPWYLDSRYVLDSDFVIESEWQNYFKLLKIKSGIELTDGQKRWYIKKRQMMKDKMFREYPSTLEECFQASVEGAYFKNEMQRVYEENRITKVPHDPLLLVDTWWDLGMNDMNVVVLTQTKGRQIRFIDMYWNNGMPLSHYYEWLERRRDEKGYRYGRHHLPHDIEVRELGTGISRKETLYKLGMRNIIVGIKQDVNDSIDLVRNRFPLFWFSEENCTRLAEALQAYKKEFDHKLGVFKNKPLHDENSHFADPVRLLAQLWKEVTIDINGLEHKMDEEQAFFG